MKRSVVIIVAQVLFMTVSYSQSISFQKLIESVPIDSSTIGRYDLYELDSLQYDFNFNWNALAWDINKDIKNEYGLNDYFDYDAFKDQIKHQYSLLHRQGRFIFARRLPKVGNRELLLYYIERFHSFKDKDKFPQWVLLCVNNEGKIKKVLVVAEVDCRELDQICQTLFLTQEDGILIKDFLGPWEGDPEWYSPEYLYCRDTRFVSFTDL